MASGLTTEQIVDRYPTPFEQFWGTARSATGGIRRTVESLGQLYALVLDTIAATVRELFHGRFAWREFVDQAWFLASVSVLPAVLIAIPFGLVVVLEVGGLAGQIGASSFVGAVDAIGTVREASPIVTALLLAGAGGSAICSELGARTIRDEIAALEVMGINPLERLVAPRMLATMVVAVLLNGIVAFSAIASGYFADLTVLHGSAGGFLSSFATFSQPADLIESTLKAAIFGLIAAVVASYKGMTAKRGPAGVGEAVTQAVVLTGISLFFVDIVLTEIFLVLVPPRDSVTAITESTSQVAPTMVQPVKGPHLLQAATEQLAWIGRFVVFAGKTFANIPYVALRHRNEVYRLLADVTFGGGLMAVAASTVLVVFVIAAFVGITIGLEGYQGLQIIGLAPLAGYLSSYANTREIAPLITAFGLAAQMGCKFTTQLGAMRINDEIDALEVMGIRSLPYLVTTRLVSALIVVTPLYLIALSGAYLATQVTVILVAHQGGGTYAHYFHAFLTARDVLLSMTKVWVFVVLITVMHCYYGYTVRGGPEEVGRAAGRAIRASIVIIALSDMLMTLAFWGTSSGIKFSG